MKTRRVGSITCGLLLIGFGILFLLHAMIPTITFTLIFRLWPLVLICLGVELLIANMRSGQREFQYDLGAVALIVILAVFAMCMGFAEFCMEHGAVCYDGITAAF